MPFPTPWALSPPSLGTAEFPGSLKEEHLEFSRLWLQPEVNHLQQESLVRHCGFGEEA